MIPAEGMRKELSLLLRIRQTHIEITAQLEKVADVRVKVEVLPVGATTLAQSMILQIMSDSLFWTPSTCLTNVASLALLFAKFHLVT